MRREKQVIVPTPRSLLPLYQSAVLSFSLLYSSALDQGIHEKLKPILRKLLLPVQAPVLLRWIGRRSLRGKLWMLVSRRGQRELRLQRGGMMLYYLLLGIPEGWNDLVNHRGISDMMNHLDTHVGKVDTPEKDLSWIGGCEIVIRGMMMLEVGFLSLQEAQPDASPLYR
jgi:hypothetical protein